MEDGQGTNSETVDNFHPISVLPVVTKVFEWIVHHQLSTYLQKSNVQSGFRPQHTTQDVLVGTIDDWRQALDEVKLVGSVMVDLSKAFDTVSHSILLDKLASYGVRAGEMKWFDDHLNGRKQRVCIGPVKSAWSDIYKKVFFYTSEIRSTVQRYGRQHVNSCKLIQDMSPVQGSILGPLFFTLYVNDLPQAVVQREVKQCADDTTLYCASESPKEFSDCLSVDLAGVAIGWSKKD